MWYLTSVYSHDTLPSLPANSGLGKVCLVLPYSAVTKTPIQSESNSLRHTSFSVLSSIGLLTDQHQTEYRPFLLPLLPLGLGGGLGKFDPWMTIWAELLLLARPPASSSSRAAASSNPFVLPFPESHLQVTPSTFLTYPSSFSLKYWLQSLFPQALVGNSDWKMIPKKRKMQEKEETSSRLKVPLFSQGCKRQRIMVPASSVPATLSVPSSGPASCTRCQLARSTSASVLPSTTTAGGDEEMSDDRQEEGVKSILPEHELVLEEAAVVYLFLSEPRLFSLIRRCSCYLLSLCVLACGSLFLFWCAVTLPSRLWPKGQVLDSIPDRSGKRLGFQSQLQQFLCSQHNTWC